LLPDADKAIRHAIDSATAGHDDPVILVENPSQRPFVQRLAGRLPMRLPVLSRRDLMPGLRTAPALTIRLS
jgi:flagellar biosynthesis component FlhA